MGSGDAGAGIDALLLGLGFVTLVGFAVETAFLRGAILN